MDVKEFKKRVVMNREILIVSFKNIWQDYSDYEISEKDLLKIKMSLLGYRRKLTHLKSMTKYFDYKCDFDENGKCCDQRRPGTEWPTKKCCCKLCNFNIGYLKIIPEDKLEYYASIFHKITGFWRAGKGCAIEKRSDRSTVCLTYNCHPDLDFREDMRNYRALILRYEYGIREIIRLRGLLVIKD